MTSAYTRDVSFPATFSPQQAPIHISAVAALHGVRRDFKGRFTYCDYGCGQGLTLALVAACYPEAQFFGVDMNSAHIETARAFASSCSIENVEFIEADFLSMNSGDLPLLDFAAVSGVYSWLPAEKRRRLACIIAGGLKDGGACALQYRCMPGSASRLTTDGLATFLAGRASGASSARIVSALSAVSHIIDAPDLAFNKVNPTAREHLKEQLAADPDYLAHDILNADYAGVWFHQVAEEFRRAGLGFVAQLRPQMNACPDLLEPQLARRMSSVAENRNDPIVWQELVNLAVNAGSRWDLFVKPHGDSSDETEPDVLQGLFVRGLAGRDHKGPRQALSGRVAVDLTDPAFDFALDMVADGEVAFGLMANRMSVGAGAEAARRILRSLFALGLIGFSAAALAEPRGAANPVFSAQQKRILFESLRYEKPQPFPSRSLGNCVPLALRDRVILTSMACENVEAAWALIEEKGAGVRSDGGREIMSLERFRAYLSEAQIGFRAERLPDLQRLGLFC